MAVTMNLKGTSNPTFKVGNASDGGAQLGYVDFNTTATVADAVGRMKWNSGDGTLDIGLAGGQSTLQVGQELLVRIKNNTGSTLTDGQVVYVTGAQGQRPTVALADADIEASSAATIGVVTETIADAAEGFVTLAGLVRNVNTIAWVEGTQLFLSSTAGALTSTKPVPPVHAVRVGWVVRSHASAGSILVQVQNGYELDELHDVLVNNPQNDQILTYEASTGLWKNKTYLVGSGSQISGVLNVEEFANGVNFTAGTTTQLTLLTAETGNGHIVAFDGVIQFQSTYAIAGSTITFSSAIPRGGNKVQVIRGLDSTATGAPTTTKTSNYTATASDYTVRCDATTNSITVNLPSASSNVGKIYNIKKVDTSGNIILIVPVVSETIDGEVNHTISLPYANLTLQSNGIGWDIL